MLDRPPEHTTLPQPHAHLRLHVMTGAGKVSSPGGFDATILYSAKTSLIPGPHRRQSLAEGF
jgi:hypothetical protein